MKHADELKLRHLVISHNGSTNCKDGFTELACKNLNYVNDMTINFNFTPFTRWRRTPKT